MRELIEGVERELSPRAPRRLRAALRACRERLAQRHDTPARTRFERELEALIQGSPHGRAAVRRHLAKVVPPALAEARAARQRAQLVLALSMKATPRCQAVLSRAHESLERFGHTQVTGAHLVLGLLTLRGGVADGVLRKAGVSAAAVEAFLAARVGEAEPGAVRDGVPLGRSALAAFERAVVEAGARRHTLLGVEHLLLGLLAARVGEAAALWAAVHVDREAMRRQVAEGTK